MSIEIDTAEISFSLPDCWIHKPQDDDSLYFEREDGFWGAYIKSLHFDSADETRSPEEVAAHIQEVHQNAFVGRPKTQWQVSARTAEKSEDTATSTLDLHDQSNRYRIVSHVRVRGRRATQLTLHHYLCDSTVESEGESTQILLTIRWKRADA